MDRHYAFDASLAGLWATCEGGGPAEGGIAAREFFRGRLTGLFYVEGDPPWRWFEMSDLEVKPPGYAHASVWCEEGFLFIEKTSTAG